MQLSKYDFIKLNLIEIKNNYSIIFFQISNDYLFKFKVYQKFDRVKILSSHSHSIPNKLLMLF